MILRNTYFYSRKPNWFFYTEFGELNKVVHLYGYDSYEDRDKEGYLAKNKVLLIT